MRKTKDGIPYGRMPDTEARLRDLERLSLEQINTLAALPRGHADFVPHECLLYFVRSTRTHNSSAAFERLYKLLIERVLRLLPNADSRDGKSTALTPLRIREIVRDVFVNALVLDQIEYNERLDYYEIRFEAALKRLRMTAQEQAWREENRRSPLQANDGDPDLGIEVERAAGSLDAIDGMKKDGEDYRTSLDAAIDTLPIEQIRIIEMQRLGLPIHSETDPNAVTIAKTLGKAEKTIRTHRDKAYEAIRAHRERNDT